MDYRFLLKNGTFSSTAESPSVTSLLETYPGAYTTTRTHNNGSVLLFWERHTKRLSNSLKLLLMENPKLLFYKNDNTFPRFSKPFSEEIMWDSLVHSLLDDSIRKLVPFIVKFRKLDEEFAITVLLSGNLSKVDNLNTLDKEASISNYLDVYVHLSGYTPPIFGGKENSARLAVVGRGRSFANAKYSDWVRVRKCLEKLRPPSVTELVLSSDGDRILEGCLTNFFVICFKEDYCSVYNKYPNKFDYLKNIEIQSAPTHDGVLPGVIRQVVKEACLKLGISFREIAPSWSNRELWLEAFITNIMTDSLRVLQPVETVQAPEVWNSIETNSWEEISWTKKQFEVCPGRITTLIQQEVMTAAELDSMCIASLIG